MVDLTIRFFNLVLFLCCTASRFVLEFGFQKPACGSDDDRPPDWWYKVVDDIHYLHFGLLLWGITGVVAIAVSLCTRPIGEEHLYRWVQ